MAVMEVMTQRGNLLRERKCKGGILLYKFLPPVNRQVNSNVNVSPLNQCQALGLILMLFTKGSVTVWLPTSLVSLYCQCRLLSKFERDYLSTTMIKI